MSVGDDVAQKRQSSEEGQHFYSSSSFSSLFLLSICKNKSHLLSIWSLCKAIIPPHIPQLPKHPFCDDPPAPSLAREVGSDFLADMAGYRRPTPSSLKPALSSPNAALGSLSREYQLLTPRLPHADPIAAFITVLHAEHLLILFNPFLTTGTI
ncbi:hypothetical protein EYF80_028114 [Liparis tanakae]|uniref:Uncharacterized protein n=1 Tax=Liparis tanakae TaxID=230148 RepID=A0A4Z2H9X8_9TELE|nr:hypothetical protein EYF80_028114 [Liparis tanakae]